MKDSFAGGGSLGGCLDGSLGGFALAIRRKPRRNEQRPVGGNLGDLAIQESNLR